MRYIFLYPTVLCEFINWHVHHLWPPNSHFQFDWDFSPKALVVVSACFSSRSLPTATFTTSFPSLQDRQRCSASCLATERCCLFDCSRDGIPLPVNFWHCIRCSHRHAGVLGVWSQMVSARTVWTTQVGVKTSMLHSKIKIKKASFKWEQEKVTIEDSIISSAYWSHFLSTLGERRKECNWVYSHQCFYFQKLT